MKLSEYYKELEKERSIKSWEENFKARIITLMQNGEYSLDCGKLLGKDVTFIDENTLGKYVFGNINVKDEYYRKIIDFAEDEGIDWILKAEYEYEVYRNCHIPNFKYAKFILSWDDRATF